MLKLWQVRRRTGNLSRSSFGLDTNVGFFRTENSNQKVLKKTSLLCDCPSESSFERCFKLFKMMRRGQLFKSIKESSYKML
jgi:hypothetical protein